MAMTVDMACELLDALGCGDDPMVHRGHETTAREMWDTMNAKASRVRIRYYNRPGWRYGSLYSMVMRRIREC